MECSVIYFPTNGRHANLVPSLIQTLPMQDCTAPKDFLFARTCAQLLMQSLEAWKLRARAVLHTTLVICGSDAPSLQERHWGSLLGLLLSLRACVWHGSTNLFVNVDVIVMTWSAQCGPSVILLWDSESGIASVCTALLGCSLMTGLARFIGYVL